MQRLLGEIEFRDAGRAAGNLAQLAQDLPEEIQHRLRSLLASSPDPDGALHLLGRLRIERPEAFQGLIATTAGVQTLVAVFSYSRFLSEAVLVHPDWLEDLIASGELDRHLSGEDYQERLETALEGAGVPLPLELAAFRRRQMLRILLRDVMGLCTLPETTEELSNLADAILDVCFRRIRAELALRHGPPGCGFSILALGKLGGRELNYSSDIDLMFLYGHNGETEGPNRITYK
jgi:glutamate-ammonia-ligase adenylyltransferase